MWFGLVSALFAAVCYGVASTVQAVVAQSTQDDKHGIDPRLLVRLLRQWRYLASLALDIVGLVAQIAALRTLPLFLVQAALSASIAVTAVLAVKWFGVRLAGIEWGAVVVVCAGLALLGLSAESEGAGQGSRTFHFWLLAASIILAGVGALVGRLPDARRTPLLGLVSGLEFGALGLALRVIPSLSPLSLLRDPATYTVVVAGIVAGLFYASALQRGGVVSATAMMLIGETIPPAVLGVVLLGDHARPGWTPVAIAGFVIAVGGAVGLARFGEIEKQEPEPETERVGATGD
jgi:drug/metabolite transporter (DMT)-like permease